MNQSQTLFDVLQSKLLQSNQPEGFVHRITLCNLNSRDSDLFSNLKYKICGSGDHLEDILQAHEHVLFEILKLASTCRIRIVNLIFNIPKKSFNKMFVYCCEKDLIANSETNNKTINKEMDQLANWFLKHSSSFDSHENHSNKDLDDHIVDSINLKQTIADFDFNDFFQSPSELHRYENLVQPALEDFIRTDVFENVTYSALPIE